MARPYLADYISRKVRRIDSCFCAVDLIPIDRFVALVSYRASVYCRGEERKKLSRGYPL